uniref:Uncharacterized protein n=1 Tax=Oryza glumipatula TaxID=40148 RepID=A0A0E0B388_9ORYZ
MAARPTGGTAANRRRSLAVIVSKCKAAVGRRRSRGWSGFSGNRGHRFPPSSAAARAVLIEREFRPLRLGMGKILGTSSQLVAPDSNYVST